MFERHPLRPEAWPAGIGPGWRTLLEQLDAELHELDPACFIWAVELDAVLQPRVWAPRHLRARARALARQTASRSATVCESCGGPARARAGATVTVRCRDCDPA
jgi:hypothetical protein